MMKKLLNNVSIGEGRRDTLKMLAAGTLALGTMPVAPARGGEPGQAEVLRDPDNPVLGNPDGDITIVEWFDFNCPYCRKLEPELRQVVQDDGKVRLVMKDWPILGPESVAAARMALACKYQGKYDKAHDAMIGVSSKLTEPRIYELVAAAGVDVDRAKADLAANARAIDKMLARNNETAEGLGFRRSEE